MFIRRKGALDVGRPDLVLCECFTNVARPWPPGCCAMEAWGKPKRFLHDPSVTMSDQAFQVKARLLCTFNPDRAAVHTKHAMGAQRNAAEARAQGR